MAKRMTSCRWCGHPITQLDGAGRVREFCRDSHRSGYHSWFRRSDRPVTLAQLVRRDGLACGICSGPVDLAVIGPLAATIDHIVPVARGGGNDLGNLQIAHKQCNSKKCDRLGFACPPVGSEGDTQLQFPGFVS